MAAIVPGASVPAAAGPAVSLPPSSPMPGPKSVGSGHVLSVPVPALPSLAPALPALPSQNSGPAAAAVPLLVLPAFSSTPEPCRLSARRALGGAAAELPRKGVTP